MGQGRRHPPIPECPFLEKHQFLITQAVFSKNTLLGPNLSIKNRKRGSDWPKTLFCLQAVSTLFCSAISHTYAFQCLRKMNCSISVSEKF